MVMELHSMVAPLLGNAYIREILNSGDGVTQYGDGVVTQCGDGVTVW